MGSEEQTGVRSKHPLETLKRGDAEWSEWDERHGRYSREVAVERRGSSRDTNADVGEAEELVGYQRQVRQRQKTAVSGLKSDHRFLLHRKRLLIRAVP